MQVPIELRHQSARSRVADAPQGSHHRRRSRYQECPGEVRDTLLAEGRPRTRVACRQYDELRVDRQLRNLARLEEAILFARFILCEQQSCAFLVLRVGKRMDGQMNDGEPAKRLFFELSFSGLLTEEFYTAVGEYGNGVFNLGPRRGERRQLRLSLRIKNTGRSRS